MAAWNEETPPRALERHTTNGQKIISALKARSSLLFVVLTVALIAWFAVIASATYDFANPQARALSTTAFGYYADIFTKVPTGFGLVWFLVFFLLSAIGPGDIALRLLRLDWRDEVERAIFACATGLIVLTFVVLIIGSAGFLQRPVCFGLLSLACASTLWYGWQRWCAQRWSFGRPKDRIRRVRSSGRAHLTGTALINVVLGLVLLWYLYQALLGGLSPEVGFDARWYHLGQVRAYVEHERFYDFIKETRMAAASYDPYQMVLYTDLWKMTGMVGAKLLHWGDALLAAGMLIYFCFVHFRSVRMGLVAAIIFVSTPIITWSAGTGGNDLQLSFYALLSIHAFLRWREKSDSVRWLVLLGFLSGYAVASKLIGVFGFCTLLLGVLIVCLRPYAIQRSRSVRKAITCLMVTCSAALIACLPWLVRSTVETGNPVFPMLNTIFHSPYWNTLIDKEQHRAFKATVGNRSLSLLLHLPWDAITIEPRSYRAILGPLFTFSLPIWIVICSVRSRRRDPLTLFRLLMIYLGVWIAFWFISGALDLRYAVGILPLMAMLVAYLLIIQRWPGWGGKLFHVCLCLVVVGTVALNIQPLVPYQRLTMRPGSFGYAYVPWMYLYDGITDVGLMAQQPLVLQYTNQNLNPAVDKIYDAQGLIDLSAYSDIQIFNGSGYEGPTGMQQWSIFSPDVLVHLRQEHITYLFITDQQFQQILQTPLQAHIKEVYRPPDKSGVLFKLI